MKASYRNQRQGCSAKHNDRTNITYGTEKEVNNQLYVLRPAGLTLMKQNKNGTMEKSEIKAYKQIYGSWLEKRNETQKKNNHYDRVKTMEEIYKSSRYKPEETIYQIGSAEKGDDLKDIQRFKKILGKTLAEEQKRFPNVKILSVAIHADEKTLHAHVRKCYVTKDQEPGMEKALEEMGIERPDLNKPNGKYNNRKITYTDQTREIWYQEIEKELDITIDRTVECISKKRKTKNEHIIEKQEELIHSNEVRLKEQNELIQKLKQNDQIINHLNNQKSIINDLQRMINKDISHWSNNELETRLAVAEKTIELLGPKAKELHNKIDSIIRSQDYSLEYDE